MRDAPPDERLELEGASCGLWWRGAGPSTERIGVIGELAMRDGPSGARLLERACRALAVRGCVAALGPMDGSTWRAYRAVVASDGRRPFFREPCTSAHVAAAFVTAGFAPAASYVSSVEEPIGAFGNGPGRVGERAHPGILLRAFDPSRSEEELRGLYPLCLAAFASNPYFTPIDEDAFVALHAPLAAMLDPHLALVAELDGTPVGFGMAFPDLPTAVPTVVLKTLAVMPGQQLRGLGRRLASELAESARALGYRRAIHALMHEANPSAAWSARRGRPFRRYALFRRPLALESPCPRD